MILHTVRDGETVYGIAKEYNISPALLIRENLLTEPDALTVGEVLIVFQPQVAYIVRRGDTLTAIAERTGTTVNELYRLNPILGGRDALLAGQELTVKVRETPIGDLRTRAAVPADTGKAVLRALLPYLTELAVIGGDEEAVEKLQQLAAGYGTKILRYLDRVDKDTEEAIARETAAQGFRGLVVGDDNAAVCPRLKDALAREGLSLSCEIRAGERADCCDDVTVVAYGGSGDFFNTEKAKAALDAARPKTRWLGYPGFAEVYTRGDSERILRVSSCLALPLCRDFGARIERSESGAASATLSLGDSERYRLLFCDGISAERALGVITDTGANGISVTEARCFDPVLWQTINLHFRIVKDE